MNHIWIVEQYYVDKWVVIPKVLFLTRQEARESYTYNVTKMQNIKVRIRKFVRETPALKVRQMSVEEFIESETKLSNFIKSVEKAHKDTEKSKLRFP